MTVNVFYKDGEIAVITLTYLSIVLKGLLMSKWKFEEYSILSVRNESLLTKLLLYLRIFLRKEIKTFLPSSHTND